MKVTYQDGFVQKVLLGQLISHLEKIPNETNLNVKNDILKYWKKTLVNSQHKKSFLTMTQNPGPIKKRFI